MTRRPRGAALGAVLLGSAVLTGVLTAAPAFAANDLGPLEGENPGRAISVGEAALLYALIPLGILVVVAALAWLPNVVKADRYRPTRGWNSAPVWFAGPPDPVAAVETADTAATSGRGGASGSW